MPLTNADNPAAEKPKKKPEPAPEPEPVVLARAAAASDAGVQNLLARRGCTEDEAQIAAIDAELAALGYAV
jgi:hypothetical protein